MKVEDFSSFSDAELVQTFLKLSLSRAEAVMATDVSKLNRLYPRSTALKDELRRREGDKRRLLISLYNHPNPQVRIDAATATLAIFPEEASRALQLVCDRQEHPYALEAGMRIDSLRQGIFKPA